MELTYTSGTRPLPEAHGESAGQFYSVTQLALDLGVTARTIRFYEDKGLISPRRAGNNRVYTLRDRARMILILRGKKLGFSLREIKEFLDLYDVDPTQAKQLRLLLTAVHDRIVQLEDQRVALDEALGELRDVESQTHNALEALGNVARSPDRLLGVRQAK
jgi:DNA-binding transcriptional MerR regulator